mgnify:CR=1 FL=1|jgi:conserved hypothetical protein TIGR00247
MDQRRKSREERKAWKEQMLEERAKEARIVRRIVFPLTVALLILFAGIATGVFIYIKNALKPVDPASKETVTVEIPLGTGVSSLAQILEDSGIVKDARVFKYYVKFKNEHGFQAGTYELSPSMTLDQIIASLKTGKVYKDAALTITIPEGVWLKDIARIIAEKTGYSEEAVFSKLNDRNFIASLMEMYPELLTDEILHENIKYPLEGYLFPATYSFEEKMPPIEDIVYEMLDKTWEVVSQYLPDIEARDMSIHQLLTMASLIEEEAPNEEDRKTIASVFYNRLAIGMKLQTDPTVLYAMGEHKERLYFKDYEYKDPYNTYEITGLPPGPIAASGVSSIEAALYPKKTNYYYFLATKDGKVLYSETLAEHEEKYKEHILN